MSIEDTVARLRQKGDSLGACYVHAGPGSFETRMYVVVDGTPLAFDRVQAIDEGRTTLAEVVRILHGTPLRMCPSCRTAELVFRPDGAPCGTGPNELHYRCPICRQFFKIEGRNTAVEPVGGEETAAVHIA